MLNFQLETISLNSVPTETIDLGSFLTSGSLIMNLILKDQAVH